MPSSALRALLHDAVDYAGFFPPADLSLEEAIRNYAAYRRYDEAWMLGRFVCRADQLAELDAMSDLFQHDPPVRFSVLAGRGDAPGDFLESLAHDIGLAEQLHARHAGSVRVDALEMRLPAGLLTSDTAALGGFLRDVLDEAEDADLATPEFFLEIPLDERAAHHATFVAGAVATRADDAFGLKLRCGGPAPADHPAPDRLAGAMLAALNQDVPFKATAGLHHPFRHYSEDAGAKMHGFVNVFGGAALAVEHDLTADELQRILEDDASEHFTFEDDALTWRGSLPVSAEAIRGVRRALALSFGSCSFDDPRADLCALGLL